MREPMVSTAVEPGTQYASIPLTGLAGREPVSFPIYLRTAASTWVLYRDLDAQLGEDQIQRLLGEGVRELFIRAGDRSAYLRRIERALPRLLEDATVPVERRAEVLHGVATTVAAEVLARTPDQAGIERSQRLLVATSRLILREHESFQALRSLLGASRTLAQHSVTVGFLAMGLARAVLLAEPNLMVMAGLAGLFHDVGRVGWEEVEHDPEHTQRGHDLLKKLGLPPMVCEAALLHHERLDGSGFPRGLRGDEIPELARIVGLVDVFDKVYSTQMPRVGVYDALRIMAQAYRGCFEQRLATSFVRLFR
jgi:putative nucleotidyltransferase with HDIG domain